MLRTRAAFLGMLAIAGLALAQSNVQPARTTTPLNRAVAVLPNAVDGRNAETQRALQEGRMMVTPAGYPFPSPVRAGAQDGQLEPRAPLTKLPNGKLEAIGGGSGRLVLKFMDAAKVRAKPDGSVLSLTNRDLSAVADIALGANLQFAPTIRLPAETVSAIEAKAASYSKRAQPDLGGMVYVTTLDGGPVPLEAAQALNDLDFVEFVYFEPIYVEVGGGPTGACCLPNGSCVDMTEAACDAVLGDYHGDGTTCANPCEACSGSCFDPDGNGTPGCYSEWDTACCQTVCDLSPDTAYCCTTVWDSFCVAVAQLVCNPVCGQQDAGSCFDDNDDPYCEDEECCNTICDIEPLCCDEGEDGGWDDLCAALANLFCGQPGCGNNSGGCFEINDLVGCQDEDCCELVCDLDPFCCEEDDLDLWPGRGLPRWDPWCVEHARVLCPGVPTDVCGNPAAGPCFESHIETVGCEHEACCETVCSAEPSCCSIEWDIHCADLAIELCLPPDLDGPTPSFADAQGYYSPFSYVQEYGSIPFDIVGGLQFDADGVLLDGYQGQGYNMQGLWLAGEFLLENGLGEIDENLTRGKSIRVGIVEFDAFIENAIGNDAPYRHEDLHGKVIPEPGQTMVIFPGEGHHGTATLGIVGAIDHDNAGNEEPDGLSPNESRAQERGIVGLAPEADLYFFPISSIEEGSRLLGAIGSALAVFDRGDVLSFSIGPAFGCGTLASDLGTWLMLRLAADLGITCCVAAGNSCCDLDTGPQADGESDVVIVGAIYPGRGSFNRYCRLGFSNYCGSCAFDGAVHISAWGTSVATLGYGSMFFPDGDLNRSYANGFNGTSAAAPQVAALVACLQGLSKQKWGITLHPLQIREIISGNGWAQCGYLLPEDQPGNSTDPPCLGDWDFDQQPPNRIGVWLPSDGDVGIAYTEITFAGEAVIKAPFNCDEGGALDSFEIYRGIQIFGNINSLRCPDGNNLIIKSQFTQPTHNIDLGVVYLAPGHITDVMVAGRSEDANPANMSLNVVTTFVPQGQFNTFFLIFGELYDWVQNRWVLVGFAPGNTIPDGGGPFLYSFPVIGNAAVFVRDSDNVILMRIWTLTLGGDFVGGFGGGTPINSHVMHHDLIGVGTAGDGGVIIP